MGAGDEASPSVVEGDPEEPSVLPLATTPPAQVEREELLRAEERRTLNVYAGLDVVTQYIARGLVFLDEASLQPWLELDRPLLRERGSWLPVETLSVFGGTWSNVNLSGSDDGLARTGRAAELEAWYEADIYGGLRVRPFPQLLVSLRYNYYTSPSDSFRDIHELDGRISLDDTALWRRLGAPASLSLEPSLRIAKEVEDRGGPENLYVQPSLTPTWRVGGLPLPLTLQLPLILGFGADGQYRDSDGDEHAFGFFQTGLHGAVDLDLLPERRGAFRLTLGYDLVVLSDEDLGLERERTEQVVRAGLSYAF